MHSYSVYETLNIIFVVVIVEIRAIACFLVFFLSWLKTHWNIIVLYSLHFKIKITFGHYLRYKIKVTFGEISLKLRQTNYNVARNNVIVVVDELPSKIAVYTCLIIDIWT